MVSSKEIRDIYINFFKDRNHKEIPPSPLVLSDDPTTLFTSSGMQQLVVHLMGKPHPQGKRLVDSQPCIRLGDIDKVGDNRHLTFFEMLGNWSLGDYFKDEQLAWIWEFFTKRLNLPKKRLYVTVFKGNKYIQRDEETLKIWKSLGVSNDHIFLYGDKENWWSRFGTPSEMPPGEIGGPDSEIFFDFGTPHNTRFGKHCHPNCNCGRFLEIGNSVFIQYKKKKDGNLEELSQKNVDFGGGLERITAAVNNTHDIFATDLFNSIIQKIQRSSGKLYSSRESKPQIRIIADHLKSATFLIASGIEPSNKAQGYVLRRLLRRAAVKMRMLRGGFTPDPLFINICEEVIRTYDGVYLSYKKHRDLVEKIVGGELSKFGKTLDRGLKKLETMVKQEKPPVFSGEKAFFLYETYGFPMEITDELIKSRGFSRGVDKKAFDRMKKKHAEYSRSTSAGMFRGGLANESEETKKLHTATHLLHQALREVLGNLVQQKGSNITAERLRFDFSFNRKLTSKEIKKVEDIVNEQIKKKLPVTTKVMSLEEAKKLGALALFEERYKDKVSVYMIGDFSKEVCLGPHVKNTKDLGRFKIIKEESIGSNTRRIKAILI